MLNSPNLSLVWAIHTEGDTLCRSSYFLAISTCDVSDSVEGLTARAYSISKQYRDVFWCCCVGLEVGMSSGFTEANSVSKPEQVDISPKCQASYPTKRESVKYSQGSDNFNNNNRHKLGTVMQGCR